MNIDIFIDAGYLFSTVFVTVSILLYMMFETLNDELKYMTRFLKLQPPKIVKLKVRDMNDNDFKIEHYITKGF